MDIGMIESGQDDIYGVRLEINLSRARSFATWRPTSDAMADLYPAGVGPGGPRAHDRLSAAIGRPRILACVSYLFLRWTRSTT
jgi:hypothetical protein